MSKQREEIKEVMNSPQFKIVRMWLIQQFGNSLRSKEENYFKKETRQFILNIQSKGYKIIKG